MPWKRSSHYPLRKRQWCPFNVKSFFFLGILQDVVNYSFPETQFIVIVDLFQKLII